MSDLRIEITEEEILADLAWPAPPPGAWPVPEAASDRAGGSAESGPAPSSGRRTALA
jgi:hypothetical protein